MNTQSLDAVVENWYARLNRLKDRYVYSGDLTPDKKEQLIRLIGIMIGRMMKLLPQYIEAKSKSMTRFHSFHNGGVILKGTEHL